MNIDNTISSFTTIENELIKLQNENLTLKANLTRLSQDERNLLNRTILEHEQTIIDHERTILEHEQTIRELRAENAVLREQIAKLETTVKVQNNRISYLENEIIVLKDENLIRKRREEEHDRAKYLDKLCRSINDSNACYGLENKFRELGNKPIASALFRLRKTRNYNIHFLFYEKNDLQDTPRILQAKINMLIDRLKNLPKTFKNEFIKFHPLLIEELLTKLEYKEIVPELSIDEQNETEDFWLRF